MRTIITKGINKKCKRKYCKSAYHRKFFNLAEKKKWRKKKKKMVRTQLRCNL